jgi:adenosylcobinamide-GDP ribazoletransferase
VFALPPRAHQGASLRKTMRLYLIALQFLTIIPLPFSVRCEEKDLGKAMSFFPLVGLTLGALLVAANFILSLCLPREIVDLLLVAILAIVTGVLHLDGLADVFDGLAARGGRERFLAVMKDSATGAAGAIGLVLVLLLKYQALLHVPIEYKHEALFCFPMLARFAQVQMTVGSNKARADGLGTVFIGGAGWLQLLVATLFTLAATYLLLGTKGFLLFIASYLLTWGFKAWFHHRLRGITGDIIGFVSELNEVLCLLVIISIFAKGAGVIA